MLKGRLSLFAPLELILFTLVLIGLHLAARNHYLLFHTLAELFSVNVALTIFVLTINSWQRIEHPYLRWIGVSYGFVAILDLFHSLAYPGMGVFRVHPFAAPQFWIQARFVEAFSMLLGWVGWHRARQLGLWPLLGGYVVLTAALLASVLYFNNFPVCFVSGHGLTPFKVFSEYLIIEVLLIDLLLLYQRRDSFSPSVWRLLAFSVLVAIVTEYAFTRYSSNQMSDPFNELGHVLKIVSFYLIYRALVVTGIQDPLKLLFRESQRRQSRLLEVQTLARLVAWEWSVERDVWQWSGDVQGIFGLWPGSLHNLSAFVSLLSPEEGKALQQALYRVARDGDRVALNLIIPGPEQSCYCRLEAQRGQNAFGSRVVVGSLQDISLQQRLLEMEQIQTRKNYLQTLLRQASDGIFILDRDGNILEASDSLHEMLGYERSQLLTMNMAHIDGHNGQFQDMLARQFEQTHRFQFETLYQRQDGSRLDVDVSGYPISFEGKLVLFYAVRDISRRKAIEASLQHERQLNEAILNLAGPMLLVIDRSGCILRFNRAAEHFTGFSFAQVQNQPYFWRRFLIEEERETVEQTFLRCFQGTLLETGENFWINAQGERRLIRWSNALLFEEEQPQALISVGIDVTALRASEQQLRIAATAFESQEGMVITDAKVRILKVNRAFQEITGYRMEELVGQNPKMLQSGRHDAAYYDSMWASIQQHGFWSGEIWNRRCNGEVYPEQLTITAVRDSSGQVTHYVGSLHDITDRKLSEAQIRQLAFYDLLTSLPNRRLFLDRLDQDIKRMARSGQKLALLFIDIDHFKEVNDLLGHNKGDQLLLEAAQRIHPQIRDTDTFARLGGDEFTVILPDCTDAVSIDRIVQKILQVMNQPFDLGMGDIAHVSCSIGIALYPDNGEDSDELMQHADQAMYVVKQGGRNGFCYFTQSMQQQAEEKINLTHDLHGALERGELEVYYQPIIEMTNRRIEKAEALLRWHHPHRGMVSPAVFIPLAEESGLILSIGAWVVDQTVQAIKDWHEATGQWIPVSVNKSPVQFARDEHMDWLQRFEQSDLPRHILTIEITEGLLLNPSTRVRDKFELFRLHDIELSIDDFGTGYSALSYLNQFDVDYLKIDRSFVQNLVTDATNRALTEAIIVMAHKLGIRTIAEGVETEEQYQLLKDFGCDYAQGFLLARPLPFSQFMERISLPSDHVPVPVP